MRTKINMITKLAAVVKLNKTRERFINETLLYLSGRRDVRLDQVIRVPMSEKSEESETWDEMLVMVAERRRKAIKRRNDRYNEKCSSKRTIQVADLVFVKTHMQSRAVFQKIHKLYDVYKGPYLCIGKPSEKVVKLVDLKDGKIFGTRSVQECKIWTPTDDVYAQYVDKIVKEMLIVIKTMLCTEFWERMESRIPGKITKLNGQ